ncbi:ATP-binding cassette sub-family C member 8 [Orchesella cincta]|uniref:ATP-binding cassette sub-family C member 8 n=1 Tax=Orchesella cincta TaxID=48709 RepID=A0A1D2NAU0_ORCCI|nr:ATP-binding cassette sub-family C member 8 [Orchesella cincta]
MAEEDGSKKLGILMGLLYLQLGYSALIGAGVCILIMIPLQFLIGKKMSSNSKELMERCDERLRTISEILQGMKLLKLHGWELLFSQKVFLIREKELKNLDKDLLYRSIMTFLTHISSVLVTVVTFGLYPFIESEKLEPPKVFAGLALFNQLTVPLFIFPITVPVVIDALVSARRVREFLLLPEASSLPVESDKDSSVERNGNELGKCGRDDGRKSPVKSQNLSIPLGKCRNSDLQASTDSVFVLENIAEDEEEHHQDIKECVKLLSSPTSTLASSSSPNGVNDLTGAPKENGKREGLHLEQNVISVQNGSFTWDESAAPLAASPLPGTPQQLFTRQTGLSEISIQIPKEKLTVVVGATGSGKSSLISAILGEMRKSNGEITWGKGTSIAYAAQKPWMLNASVRDNILFGKPFKPGRYKKVIQACALQPDIDILPENDLTEIGQKGINLSGGQKQRIATARTLYSNANVVILDDPLSALDVEVAHHVLDAGIIKLLLRSRRTVLLVTHHLPVLHHAYHIIAMEKGRIRIQGTLPEIQAKDPECYKEWQEMISRKEQELNIQREARTAKERWTLLKLVSKVGLQFKHNRMADKSGWKTDEETNAGLEPFSRKKKGTFSHYKNLSHDIFLPSDECHDEMMTPLLRRRAVSRTSRDSRTSASSISPAADDDAEAGGGNRNPGAGGVASTGAVSMGAMTTTSESLPSPPRVQDNLFKKLFSSKKTISSTGSSNTELEKISSSQRLPSTVSGASEGDLTEDEVEDPEEALLARESSQDEREYGKIPLRVYLSYITACGKLVSSLYLYSAIGYEVVRVYTNFWLSKWSDTVHQYKDDQEKYEEIMSHYFNIYVILSIATVIVSLSCNLLGKQAGANSREILHQRMMDRVVRCPVRFFESTPIGRIINRFSSDVAVVDRKLCISMQRFLQFVFLCFSAIVVNAIVNAWFLLLAIPIVAIYYYIQRFYRFSSRELQRIQAISRGPIYSHFHETLEGLSTIRAFREQKRFTNQMLARLDSHNKADMFINVGNRWLSISLDYLGGVIVFLATLAAVISSHVYPEAVTASMVGLAINYTLLVPVYLNWVVKFLAEVEMFMNSVDRIDRYAELEIEDYDGVLPPDSLPPNWPTSGHVKFENVSVQYGPDRPVIISGLSVDVTEKQKVGICGRSGSGKSSLLMALFRISDVKNGRILIDGVNIHEIPLLKLRSSFSIIPQENILFSGTLRFNLDPEGKVPDLDIWSALELCQMKDAVMEMPGQLGKFSLQYNLTNVNADIKYGGEAFSAGEKQLLALARAILHKSKVVVMDEATSSVDLGTERTLLQAVKHVFKDSTVLSIAHRLETIIDGDRVIVLEDGVLVEDGNPSALIKKPMSHFATMVRTAGEQSRRNI